MKNKRIAIAVLSIVVALTVLFIFSNSLKSREESAKDSTLIAKAIGPILEWLCGCSIENVGHVVRKLAHFSEFCVLGLATAGLVLVIDARRAWWLAGYSLLFCLFVAVCDEFIQGFIGRGSAVGDVLIDFSGAVFGSFLVIFIHLLVKSKKTKNKSHNN